MRARLDQFIGASDSELIALGHEAGEAKISGDTREINRVYNRIMQELRSRNLPQEVYRAFSVRSRRDKEVVLDYFENALMGSTSSERVAR